MKLYIFANFIVTGEFFSSPIVEKITPDEMIENYNQVVAGLSQDDLIRLKECDLYCLGTYDNVSGEIVPEKTFLLHCGDVCSRFIKQEMKESVEENE